MEVCIINPKQEGLDFLFRQWMNIVECMWCWNKKLQYRHKLCLTGKPSPTCLENKDSEKGSGLNLEMAPWRDYLVLIASLSLLWFSLGSGSWPETEEDCAEWTQIRYLFPSKARNPGRQWEGLEKMVPSPENVSRDDFILFLKETQCKGLWRF